MGAVKKVFYWVFLIAGLGGCGYLLLVACDVFHFQSNVAILVGFAPLYYALLVSVPDDLKYLKGGLDEITKGIAEVNATLAEHEERIFRLESK